MKIWGNSEIWGRTWTHTELNFKNPGIRIELTEFNSVCVPEFPNFPDWTTAPKALVCSVEPAI
jgi:hypothetical protein